LKTPSSHRFVFPLLILLLAVPTAFARAAVTPKETWIGMYLNGRKIGYSSIRVEKATYRGKPAMKIISNAVTHMEMLGNAVSQDIRSVTYTDSTYRPLYQSYDMTSNGSATRLTADYQPGKIVCTLVAGGKPATRVVPVPPGANLTVDDSSGGVPGMKVEVGQKSTFYFLEPVTISLMKTEVEVQAREKVTLDRVSYAAFRVCATVPMFGRLISWQTPEGDILKGEGPLGIAMYRETKLRAMNMKAGAPAFVVEGAAVEQKTVYKPEDIAIATALTIDKPIQNPRALKTLSLSVAGIEDRALVLSDGRQHASPVEGKADTYRLDIRAENFDPARAATLPIAEPSVQQYLRSAPYLDTEDPQIKAVAASLRGRETNAYKVAVRIRDWVHRHMKPDYTIGVPRSCTDVYKRERGVCRDYAVLYTGIARAAGIPTRVCGGIVYAEGRFFYHAWAESWIGEWVPFDPTQNTDFVDATHVKFAQGDVTDMFNVVGIVGRLKLNVIAVQ
jgi:hypothetical protein